ncbi:MAG: hypothetical protein HYZ58_06775, partial [Acidobacteria bacterium]|nr:hypothetical protein [Acidobacteriota bacterium]
MTRLLKVKRAHLLFAALNLILPIVIVEAWIVVMLASPRLVAASPPPIRQFVQKVYRHFNRSLIQFEPRCARYDPELAYTLRPGSCVFGNVEFSNAYRINRAGVRDDEASLEAPDVIVLGDSQAMGWGVDRPATFAKRLERKSGLKVLNAAVSSYGTVREMELLERLDTSHLRFLVVQYSDNDLAENRTFAQNDGRLPMMSQGDYERAVQYYASQRGYYPGKYIFRLLLKGLRLEEPEPDQFRMEPIAPLGEAELFITAITRRQASLDNVQLIVLELTEKLDLPRQFIAAVAEAKSRTPSPFVRDLITIDTARFLSPGDFYV